MSSEFLFTDPNDGLCDKCYRVLKWVDLTFWPFNLCEKCREENDES